MVLSVVDKHSENPTASIYTLTKPLNVQGDRKMTNLKLLTHSKRLNVPEGMFIKKTIEKKDNQKVQWKKKNSEMQSSKIFIVQEFLYCKETFLCLYVWNKKSNEALIQCFKSITPPI